MIVRRAIKNKTVVAGGGATEMELSSYLRTYSRTVEGKTQMIIGAFAKALEIIPRQLCDNAGFDATDILNKLRQKHAAQTVEGRWFGVDMESEDVQDNLAKFVWEPALVKINMIASASEAACLVLSVDETVKNPQAEQSGQQAVRGRGRGRR
jgi:T-complex protein 1 subunit eta